MTHELRLVEAADEWEVYHAIRERVLWSLRGQGGSYDRNHPDERRPGNFPFLLLYEGSAVGVIRIDIEPPLAWFRRVAVREDVQRRGHGRRMLELAEAFARSHGCSLVRSNVDPGAVGFYRRIGFSQLAPEHTGPTVPMERRL